MSNNPFVKPLKLFDPKSALTVDESFVKLLGSGGGDTLSDLEEDEFAGALSGNCGKEFAVIRTGGSIRAGMVLLENDQNRTIIAAANTRGEVIFFEPSAEGLKILSKISLQGSINTSPAFADGILYAATREGVVFAVDTGLKGGAENPVDNPVHNKLLWQKKMKKGILTEPVTAGRMLIVAPLNGIYGFDAFNDGSKTAGRALWGTTIAGTVSTPVLDSGTLFIGSEDRKLLAFDYGGNRLQKNWEYSLSGACRSKPCVSSTTAQVIAGTVDGFVYAVSRSDGGYKWNYVVKEPVVSSIVKGIIDGREHFFFGADNGLFYCLDQLGKKVWHFKTNGKIRTEALIHEGRIYFGSEDNNLYALDLESGREVFRFPTDGNVYSRPLVVDDKIYFGSTDAFIHSIYI